MSQQIKGLTIDLFVIDDPPNCRCTMSGFNELYRYPYLNPAVYIQTGQRFGRVVKNYGTCGELRRQKKAPHTEVLYIWIDSADNKKTLRSINNCDNNQLTQAIRDTGAAVETHTIERLDGEFVLDLLYAELGRRSNAGSE